MGGVKKGGGAGLGVTTPDLCPCHPPRQVVLALLLTGVKGERSRGAKGSPGVMGSQQLWGSRGHGGPVGVRGSWGHMESWGSWAGPGGVVRSRGVMGVTGKVTEGSREGGASLSPAPSGSGHGGSALPGGTDQWERGAGVGGGAPLRRAGGRGRAVGEGRALARDPAQPRPPTLPVGRRPSARWVGLRGEGLV